MTEQTFHFRLRRHRRKLTWSSLLIFVLVLAYFIATDPKLRQTVITAQPGLLPVVHVEDGDTITVREPDGHNEIIRLLGVDTPETVKPNTPVQCGGKAASDHTKAVMTGASVRLAPDPEDSDRDKYGRLLRYVYLPDGTLYNAELIRDGYGFAYTIFPITKLDDFKAIEADARANNRGLWGTCNSTVVDGVEQTTTAK